MAQLLLDERPHADALRQAIDDGFGQASGAHAYDLGTVPGTDDHEPDGVLPDIYATIQLEQRYAPTRRLTGRRSVAGWRVTVQCAGRTVAEARWALAHVAAALDGQVLVVDEDRTSTPLAHESGRAAAKTARESLRVTGSLTYTYAL